MGTQDPGIDVTKLAAADLRTKQFYFVKLDSNGKVALCSAAGERAYGVLQNKPNTDEAAVVRVFGRSYVVAGGTIAAAGMIKTDANGKAAAAAAGTVNTSDAGAANDPVIGSYVLGEAEEAMVANDIAEMMVRPLGAVPTTAA